MPSKNYSLGNTTGGGCYSTNSGDRPRVVSCYLSKKRLVRDEVSTIETRHYEFSTSKFKDLIDTSARKKWLVKR